MAIRAALTELRQHLGDISGGRFLRSALKLEHSLKAAPLPLSGSSRDRHLVLDENPDNDVERQNAERMISLAVTLCAKAWGLTENQGSLRDLWQEEAGLEDFNGRRTWVQGIMQFPLQACQKLSDTAGAWAEDLATGLHSLSLTKWRARCLQLRAALAILRLYRWTLTWPRNLNPWEGTEVPKSAADVRRDVFSPAFCGQCAPTAVLRLIDVVSRFPEWHLDGPELALWPWYPASTSGAEEAFRDDWSQIPGEQRQKLAELAELLTLPIAGYSSTPSHLRAGAAPSMLRRLLGLEFSFAQPPTLAVRQFLHGVWAPMSRVFSYTGLLQFGAWNARKNGRSVGLRSALMSTFVWLVLAAIVSGAWWLRFRGGIWQTLCVFAWVTFVPVLLSLFWSLFHLLHHNCHLSTSRKVSAGNNGNAPVNFFESKDAAEALMHLHEHRVGDNGTPVSPWVLVVGNVTAGKTRLLTACMGGGAPVAGPHGSQGFEWGWFPSLPRGNQNNGGDFYGMCVIQGEVSRTWDHLPARRRAELVALLAASDGLMICVAPAPPAPVPADMRAFPADSGTALLRALNLAQDGARRPLMVVVTKADTDPAVVALSEVWQDPAPNVADPYATMLARLTPAANVLCAAMADGLGDSVHRWDGQFDLFVSGQTGGANWSANRIRTAMTTIFGGNRRGAPVWKFISDFLVAAVIVFLITAIVSGAVVLALFLR